MRDLTPEECEFIAGGTDYSGGTPETPPDIVVVASPPPYYPPSDVVVVASPPPYYPPYEPPSPPAPPPYYDPGSGGGGGGSSTPDASPSANAFADSHVSFRGSTSDVDEYQRTHDNLAHFYDWATQHPNATIDIGKDLAGNSRSISAAQALADFAHIQMAITNQSFYAADGHQAAGWSSENATRDGVNISINPQSTNYAYYSQQSGTQGLDYLNFHEIGHALNYFHDRDVYNTPGQVNENAADAAAHSIEVQMGIPTIPGK